MIKEDDSEQRTEYDFLRWLSGANFYVGYARYGQLGGHGFVVATNYEDDQLLELVDDLSGGDYEALEAETKILELGCWYANNRNPVEAMASVVEQLRKYYFIELNKQAYPEPKS